LRRWETRRERVTGKRSLIHEYRLGTDLHIGSIATAKKLQNR
jgi:hypothetical protein